MSPSPTAFSMFTYATFTELIVALSSEM